jgi:L-ribulose-5-phosphate 3-epimerase
MKDILMGNSKWNIGVCSWSLQSGVNEVADVMKEIGVTNVHLAIVPATEDGGAEYLEAVKAQDWVISSTMVNFAQEDYSTLGTIKVTGGVVPDDCWDVNKKVFADSAKISGELGVKNISIHAGFIDHTDVEKYKVMCVRIKELADIAAANGLALLMETGQETADDLAMFMDELAHPALGINFDPANMILYDKGNPIEALNKLAKWIKHVHIKDATKTEVSGQWGWEVPWGDGQVDSDKFLAALEGIGFEGTIAIEREAGDQRKVDIALAAESLKAYIG